MINKKILSEIALYKGKVKMPKGFEINNEELVNNIFLSQYYENFEYPFSISFDKLNKFISDYMRLEHKLNLVPKKITGNFYEKGESSKHFLEVEPLDLRNSPDFVLLYGVEIDPSTCKIEIFYDDNRRKNRSRVINLENEEFIIFPSSLTYKINNNNNSYLNFIKKITYEYI
jgi:hypothetical protein